jgi:hypothetical protein
MRTPERTAEGDQVHDSIHAKRLTRERRPARLLAIAALLSGTLVAATTSTTPAASAHAATTARSSSATSYRAASSSSSGLNDLVSQELAYAKCMRANGVPNFPDPSPGGGFTLPNDINPSSPAYNAAQAKCHKLLPAGGLQAGMTTHPSPQVLAHWLKASQCMRKHGIYNFPDPRTSIPFNLTAIQEIADRDGVILVFPRTIDLQSPAFARAATACGFQLTNH